MKSILSKLARLLTGKQPKLEPLKVTAEITEEVVTVDIDSLLSSGALSDKIPKRKSPRDEFIESHKRWVEQEPER